MPVPGRADALNLKPGCYDKQFKTMSDAAKLSGTGAKAFTPKDLELFEANEYMIKSCFRGACFPKDGRTLQNCCASRFLRKRCRYYLACAQATTRSPPRQRTVRAALHASSLAHQSRKHPYQLIVDRVSHARARCRDASGLECYARSARPTLVARKAYHLEARLA